MTASSYPFVVKTLKRGQSLDQATEVFRGKPDDVQVAPAVLHDGEGHKLVLIVRATDFFHQETYELTPAGVRRLDLPAETEPHGLLDGRLVFTAAGGLARLQGRRSGRLPARRAVGRRRPAARTRRTCCSRPTSRQSIEQVAITSGPDRRGDLRQRPRRPVHVRVPRTAAGRGRRSRSRRIRPSASRPPARPTTRSYYCGRELPLAAPPLADRRGQRRTGRRQGPAGALRRLRRHGRPVRSDELGRNQDPLLRRPSEGHEAGRLQPDHPLRLRRLPGLHAAQLLVDDRQAVAGARRGLGAGQHPRRRRVRAGLARGGPEDPPPADLRRLRRGGEGPDRPQASPARAGWASRAAPTAAC